MDALRTPDERFRDLPGYPFAPRWVEASGLRLHVIDEGPREGPVVLLLHGEPSWSYLYRKMIPRLVAAGARAVAPDLVGFGKSDKPTDPRAYTYAAHVAWMRAVVEALDLRDATLVGQDWGGLVGLRLVAESPDRFARVVAANTYLPTGDERVPRAFRVWAAFARLSPLFPVGRIVQAGCTTRLPDAVRAAYDAPFPSDAYKVGARAFPRLVPTSPRDPATEANRAAWRVLEAWDKPFQCAFSDRDPITRGADRRLVSRVPGARSMPRVTIHGAGHFLQEDRGEELADVVVRTLGAPVGR